MLLIGVDYHPSFQQVAFLSQDTGECGELRLNHSDGEAEKFYRELKPRGVSVRVGLEFARSDGRGVLGERGTLSPIPVPRIVDFRTLTPKCLINSGFWRLRRFSSTEALGGKIHIAPTRTATKNIRVTK